MSVTKPALYSALVMSSSEGLPMASAYQSPQKSQD
jgi:hypothetical protein